MVTRRSRIALPQVLWLLLFVTWAHLHQSTAGAVPGLATEDSIAEESLLSENDASKSFEELLEESKFLLRSGRPIDARAKLQRALKMQPSDYRPHMLLGQYYLFNVAHFKLAYRYLKTAEKHFSRQFGNDLEGTLDLDQAGQHAMLLYLLSEAELNLDKYEESLATLDRFEQLYWLDWYPGTRAWVLMKLKRIDEAIKVAQAGLMRNADPRRTWNILGILLSVKGNRELSLHAFQQAIQAELSLSGSGMIATPLNNAGEVYREMFQDQYAEGAWLRAVRLPDGCEHILPSLNLANMYIDQLRLFQAERVLKDFEACFAEESIRKDSEHRSLLALARGKIKLLANDLDGSLELLHFASEQEQWFGKIGTNENDVRFAANVALAQALEAEAAVLQDTVYEHFWERLIAYARIPYLRVRAWWLHRKARRIAVEELDDLEDLFIRNTDSMVAYPTLGRALAGFNQRSMTKRIERMIQNDDRPPAHSYYRLYLAENLLAHGEVEDAAAIFKTELKNFTPRDRLARAEALAKLLTIAEAGRDSILRSESESERTERVAYANELFDLLPSHVRFHNLALPVHGTLAPVDDESRALLEEIGEALFRKRFEKLAEGERSLARYGLALSSGPRTDAGQYMVTIHLLDTRTDRQIAAQSMELPADGTGAAKLINEFIAKAFQHRVDPPGEPVPPVPILEGIL
ncbi:MAG: tetratricopeptide repeat protein [Bdellovibrionales bacterium]|nr:tetratricopeptide repeat protein [Bdellovibrionales bacterium]